MAMKKSENKMPKPPRGEVKVSPNVKVIPGRMGQSVRASSVNEKLTSGADKARAENARKTTGSAKSTAKALKNVNNPKKSSTDPRGKANVKALKAANKPTKGKADITKGELYKARNAKEVKVRSGMKPVPNRGSGRMRITGAGGLNINDLNR